MDKFAEFTRDGNHVWPYCSECGCRLQITKQNSWLNEYRLTHFGLSPTVDARGCKCSRLFRLQIVGEDRVQAFYG